MQRFYLSTAEVELIQDFRKLTEHERHVYQGAIRKSAEDEPQHLNGSQKVVPIKPATLR